MVRWGCVFVCEERGIRMMEERCESLQSAVEVEYG